MNNAKIINVWGTADSINLIFTKKDDDGTEWYCSVPSDIQDGTYACEFIAEDEIGMRGYWIGFLYMFEGICHFNMYPTKKRLILCETTNYLILEERCPHGY